ncbi:hypothetical protein ACROYT_G019896 [Oculina patagonica]
MAVAELCRIAVVLLAVISITEAFRLRARFPRPQERDFEHHAKRHVCRFCIYETRTLSQKLDHFNFNNNRTFLQRYLVAMKNWDKGQPILFYTGNEGDITWFANNTGFMWDIANEFKAMLVFAEHRYYGKSLPFGKESYKGPKYLGYLTSEQALADFAVLIRHLKDTIPGASDSPVVAIGGSYGGMLASWFRMKYPNVVVGALAASAPILQFTGMTPCEKFYQIVTQDFRRDGGDACVNSVKKTWDIVKNYGKTDDGRKRLSKIFKLCSPLKTKDNVTQLEYWLSETWVNLAMVDYPYPASFLEPLPAWPIKVACKYLQDDTLEDDKLLEAIARAVGVYYNNSGHAKCFNTSQQAVSFLGDEGWYFQACTEMVMPLCSNGVNDMFTESKWDFKDYAKDCQKSRGVTPLEYWAEIMYGGKKIKAHSNIVFSNGALDPWAAGGVTQNLTESLVAVLIEDGAHHLDLRHKNPLDPPSVVRARNIEKHYIAQWIKEYNEKRKKTTHLRISSKRKFKNISIR